MVIISMQVLVFAQDETINKKEEEDDIRKKNSDLKINRNRFKLKLPVSAKEVLKSILQGETNKPVVGNVSVTTYHMHMIGCN